MNYLQHLKKSYKVKNHIPYYIIVAVIIFYMIMSSTKSLKMSQCFMLEQIGYTIIGVLALSLVVGFLGELSLGHAAFMGIGAYMCIFFRQEVFTSLTQTSPLLSLILSMLISGGITSIFGFIIGLPALRLKGDYLAIVTLAFNEIVKVIFQNMKMFGATLGYSNKFRYDRNTLFIICFITILFTLIAINNFIKSKHGRAVMAIRDNEIAARAMGVKVTYYKLLVFVISAFFAGIAGALMSASKNQITPTNFDYNYSINILVMVVLGGMGNVNGSVISAIAITFIDVKLQTLLTGNLAALKNLIYALVLIVVVIFTNAPKLKGLREKYSPSKLISKFISFIMGKRKPNPATETNFTADWSKVPTKIEMDALLSTDITPQTDYTPDKPDKGGLR